MKLGAALKGVGKAAKVIKDSGIVDQMQKNYEKSKEGIQPKRDEIREGSTPTEPNVSTTIDKAPTADNPSNVTKRGEKKLTHGKPEETKVANGVNSTE